MSKKAISVTLEADNLLWLKARAGAMGLRSVSELLDGLVTDARAVGDTGPARSVAGTIDIDSSDLALAGADDAVRALFDGSLGRPFVVRESSPAYGAARKTGARNKTTRG